MNSNRERIIKYLIECRIVWHIKFFSLCFFLVASCQKNEARHSASLSKEEKADLDYFFRLLLFDNPGGVFVLFGSKPISEMFYCDTDAIGNKGPFLRNPALGWKAWEKARPKLPLKRYLFGLRTKEDCQEVYLVDIQKTALLLAENYEIFKACVGFDFHPLEIVFEFENPNSVFWKKVFAPKSELTKGLLFGYGKKNALMWAWWQNDSYTGQVAEYLKHDLLSPSRGKIKLREGQLAREKIRLGSGPDHFDIPFFARIEEDEQSDQYEKEKKRIGEIYRGKDLVDLTLKRLGS
jgi:hypothetical protein